MDIGLIYHRKDPRQTKARDYLRKYIREHGILARIVETDKAVASPTVIINGETLRDRRSHSRESKPSMFPGLDDIARAVDKYVWSL